MASTTIKMADIRRMVLAETGSDWFAILNRNLIGLAQEHGVELPSETQLVPIAFQAASKAGARGLQDVTEVALEAISRIVGRAPSKGGILDNAPDYLRNTVLVSLVQSGKAEGRSLDQIKKDPTVKSIVEHLGVRDSTLQRYFNGDTLPNRLIQNLKEMGQRKTRSRGSVFDEFDPSRNADFRAFFRQVVQNEARTILSERNRLKDRVINEALRFGPDTEKGEVHEERHHEFSVDEREKQESRLVARKLKEELFKLDPRYVKVLHLLNHENLDITAANDQKRFQKELGVPTREQFVQFRDQFLDDLKRVFAKLDIEHGEADLVLRSAKRRTAQEPEPTSAKNSDALAQEVHQMIEAYFAEQRKRILENGINLPECQGAFS